VPVQVTLVGKAGFSSRPGRARTFPKQSGRVLEPQLYQEGVGRKPQFPGEAPHQPEGVEPGHLPQFLQLDCPRKGFPQELLCPPHRAGFTVLPGRRTLTAVPLQEDSQHFAQARLARQRLRLRVFAQSMQPQEPNGQFRIMDHAGCEEGQPGAVGIVDPGGLQQEFRVQVEHAVAPAFRPHGMAGMDFAGEDEVHPARRGQHIPAAVMEGEPARFDHAEPETIMGVAGEGAAAESGPQQLWGAGIGNPPPDGTPPIYPVKNVQSADLAAPPCYQQAQGLRERIRMLTLHFFVTALIIVLLPGTGVMFTVATGLRHGRRASLLASLGCTAGIIPHLLATVLGLAALLHMYALAFHLVKFAGAAYLVYLAWGMWRDTGSLALDTAPAASRPGGIVLKAFLINILNPKLSIFFLAFLPQFITPTGISPLFQMLWLGGTFMAMTLVVFIAYGLLANAFRTSVVLSPNFQPWIQRSCALTLAAIAFNLAYSER